MLSKHHPSVITLLCKLRVGEVRMSWISKMMNVVVVLVEFGLKYNLLAHLIYFVIWAK